MYTMYIYTHGVYILYTWCIYNIFIYIYIYCIHGVYSIYMYNIFIHACVHALVHMLSMPITNELVPHYMNITCTCNDLHCFVYRPLGPTLEAGIWTTPQQLVVGMNDLDWIVLYIVQCSSLDHPRSS